MSLTLTVLLDNGRRQRVTTRITSLVSEILDEVCQKQTLNSDMYDLKYKNDILSISSTLDFCNIPNNSQLSLIKLSKERELLPVQIFLQMEDGVRYSGTFAPMDTLWNIITTLCPSNVVKKENPVVIYLRREILGEQLKTTTLRSLGIIGSSVLFRFFHKTAEQLSTQSVAPSVQRKLKKPRYEETNEDTSFFKKIVHSIEEQKNKLFTNKENENNATDKDNSQKCAPVVQSAMEVDVKSEEKDQMKTSEDEFKMEVDEDTSAMDNVADTVNDTSISIAESNLSNVTIPSSVTENYIEGIEYIGERYALLFLLSNMDITPKFKDPSDDFYKLTIDDAKLLIRDAKESRKEIEESELSTAAIREDKKLKKLERLFNRYPHCVVRVQFPNRAILQGIFKSDETVRDVAEFVNNFLKHPQMEFFLYITPPKKILNPNAKLYEIGIPGVLLYFGTKDTGNSGKNSSLNYLKNDVIKKATSADVVQNVANFFRKRRDGTNQNVPIIIDNAIDNSTSTSRQASDNSKSGATRPPSTATQNIVPKWFKKIF